MVGRLDHPATGFSLGLASCFLVALGLVLQKYSHVRNAKSETQVVYYRQPYWLLGFCIFLLGQILNFLALGQTPQFLLSCLGAACIVCNTLLAWLILHENVGSLVLLAITGVIAGLILTLLGTPEQEVSAVTDMEQIIEPVKQCSLFAPTALLVATSPFLWLLVSSLAPEVLYVFWAFLASMSSGYTVALFKCISMLIVHHSTVPFPWRRIDPYVILLVACAAGFLQLHGLSIALSIGDATTVVPAYFALGILFQILMGEIVYDELKDFTGPGQVAIFSVGVTLVLLSIMVVTRLQIVAEVLAKLEASEKEAMDLEGTPLLSAGSPSSRGESPLLLGLPHPRLSSYDNEAFPESFQGSGRFYTVSITAAPGLA